MSKIGCGRVPLDFRGDIATISQMTYDTCGPMLATVPNPERGRPSIGPSAGITILSGSLAAWGQPSYAPWPSAFTSETFGK